MKQSQINAFNILNNVKVTNLDSVLETININFNKGLIDEFTAEQAFEQIEILEKAMGHKYYKREGTPGNYKYYYTEAEYNKVKREKTESPKRSDSGSGEIEIGRKYHSPAPEGGEAIDFVVKKIENGKYTIETSNKDGRKGEHTFDEKTIKELISSGREGSKEKGKQTPSFNWDSEDAKILAKFRITKDNLVVNGNLDLRYTPITSLPEGLEVAGSLNLFGTPITFLPEGLEVGGRLVLFGTSITSLPEGLKVGGSLDLSETSITSLPKGLKVGERLILSETPITSLPEGLEVGGSLDLSETPITSLPKGLKVGGDLDLSGSPITSLPEGLEVGGDLTLFETSITAKDFKDSMEIGGTIRLDPKNKVKTKFRFD